MVQAARSGRQNIAEGSKAAATSAKSEALLTNVAKASLEELLLDYEDFLRHRKLPQWNKNDNLACQVRTLAKFANEDPQEHYKVYKPWIEHQSPEIAANTMICLIHQADFLLEKQLNRISEKFRKEGGFGEKMLNVRLEEKGFPPRQQRTQRPQRETPSCPQCGSAMILRTAHKGTNAGNQFWGCSKYPNCKGTREVKNG
jgi:four helix bundle suffix protein